MKQKYLRVIINVLAVLSVFSVFFIVSSHPALAVTGQVLNQSGQNYVGAKITMDYNGTQTTATTTSSGYSFADPCPFAQNGQPGSAPYTLTITVPSGYHATTATTVNATSTRGEFQQNGTGCGQMMVNGVWKHYPTSSTPDPVNFGISNVVPNCTTTPINCSACTAPANTCSNGNGTQTCTLSQPATCTGVATTQSCTLNNCNAGSNCVNQACQVITYSISGNVSDNNNANVSGVTVSAGGKNTTTDASGNYTIANLVPASYTVAMTVPSGYTANGATSQAVTLTANKTGVNFKLTKLSQISGTVYNDANQNGTLNTGETGDQGITVQVTNSSGTQTTTSAANGTYSFQVSSAAGNSTVTISGIPAGSYNTSPTSQTVASNVNTTGLNFGIGLENTISGNIFTDFNKNGTIETAQGEANYSATPVITSPDGGTVTTTTTGTYTVKNLKPGTYAVTYGGPPTGYVMTSPLTGPPISFSVTVGQAGCTVNGAPGATCTTGNITNLNFGITNTHPWFQSVCGDFRDDSGITDNLPAGQFGFVTTTSCTSPGLPFTGNFNASFGSGQATSTNPSQIVGGLTYPELYYSQSSALPTSYSSLVSKATTAGITPTTLPCSPSPSNCTLTNLAHGIYTVTGPVVLNAYTFGANQDYVILVNGNLTINGPISVPIGSTLLISASGNITVNASVGAATPTSATSNLDGWYVAGGSFILPTATNCADKRLNIAGSIVVDATGGGGTFQNSRDLCGSDTTSPTVYFMQRLDMILNAPQFVDSQQTLSQEVAP